MIPLYVLSTFEIINLNLIETSLMNYCLIRRSDIYLAERDSAVDNIIFRRIQLPAHDWV